MEVLQDEDLVIAMMPYLIWNLDEECLHAMGKNEKVAGSKGKKKHDNQNASSRFVNDVTWPRGPFVYYFFLVTNLSELNLSSYYYYLNLSSCYYYFFLAINLVF